MRNPHSELTAAQSAIQVEVDPLYMLTVWQAELPGLLLGLAAILFGIPLIRRREEEVKVRHLKPLILA